MAKTNANAAASNNAASFTIAKWRRDLTNAAKAEANGHAKLLKAVMEARGAFDVEAKKTEEKVREAAKAAYEAAGNTESTVKKRVADTMVILKAGDIPGDAPGNLQHLARFLRDINAGRDPRAGKGTGAQHNPGSAKKEREPMGKAEVVASLKGTLTGLRKRAADEETTALIDSLAAILEEDDSSEDAGEAEDDS